ncbi:hypothetical protein QR680_019277 [Steinernema hermaphroditum]|uniref:Ubiquitin-like protease family profile domain-containing protein n=1 Tax=Steinernema hermaphroditum TaxID=289476 RepID=A0AA39GQK6_9BILA|nr:hypothetical protein QR680_019277 [Steinernema hermaphroditum]
MERTELQLSDLLDVFKRTTKKLEPADFFKAAEDGSHPLLPPLAAYFVNDDSENADAFQDLERNTKLTSQTIYSWTVYLMMAYGKAMKPCLLHPQFWEPMSIGTELASNYTIGNRHDFDVLFIPILHAEHWTLAIWRAGIITYYDSLGHVSNHVSGAMAKTIVNIVETSREGIKVVDCQIVRCSKQMDFINCGVFVLLNIEQMLRTGEVWEEERISDVRYKNRYINHAKRRMQRILCPNRVREVGPRRRHFRQHSKFPEKVKELQKQQGHGMAMKLIEMFSTAASYGLCKLMAFLPVLF